MDIQLQLGPSPIDLLAAPRLQSAFALLSEANYYAQRTGSDPWDFAVEIQQLRTVGLSDNDLRFLVRLKYVDHGREQKSSTYYHGRQFQAAGNLTFTDRTCFVLTVKGMDAVSVNVDKPSKGVSLGTPIIRISSAITRPGTEATPVWDAQRRMLFFDGKVVKQFRRRAFNQEVVLAAFQEEEWPLRIYDPLAPQPCQVMKRRLNDTIKCLNRGQTRRLLHFRGDGTGEGVTVSPYFLEGVTWNCRKSLFFRRRHGKMGAAAQGVAVVCWLGQVTWAKQRNRIFGLLEHLRETRFTVPQITSSVTRPSTKRLEN